MKNPTYLTRIAIARSLRPSRSSESAYAQVDRMAKSTNDPFMTKASDGLSDGWRKKDASSKASSR